MSLINLPKTNQTGTNEWADVEDNDNAIVAVVNGDLDDSNIASGAAIDLAKIDVGSGVTDAQLASPNNSAYRTIAIAGGFIGQVAGEVANATFLIGGAYNLRSGESFSATGPSGDAPTLAAPPPIFYLNSADYAVAGKTTKLRVRGTVATNNYAPAVTFTFALCPLGSIAGGAGAISFTLGTLVSGSDVSLVTPAANSAGSATGTDFDFPSSGPYMLAVAVTGTMTLLAVTSVHAHLQVRNV